MKTRRTETTPLACCESPLSPHDQHSQSNFLSCCLRNETQHTNGSHCGSQCLPLLGCPSHMPCKRYNRVSPLLHFLQQQLTVLLYPLVSFLYSHLCHEGILSIPDLVCFLCCCNAFSLPLLETHHLRSTSEMAGLWQIVTAQQQQQHTANTKVKYRQYQNLRPGSSPCNVG